MTQLALYRAQIHNNGTQPHHFITMHVFSSAHDEDTKKNDRNRNENFIGPAEEGCMSVFLNYIYIGMHSPY